MAFAVKLDPKALEAARRAWKAHDSKIAEIARQNAASADRIRECFERRNPAASRMLEEMEERERRHQELMEPFRKQMEESDRRAKEFADTYLKPSRSYDLAPLVITSPLNAVLERIEALQLPLSRTDPAQHLRDMLVEFIADFEASLDVDEEVGFSLTDAAIPQTLWLTAIRTRGTEHIELIGTNANGERVSILRHHTQPALQLTAILKQVADEPARRIGFDLSAD